MSFKVIADFEKEIAKFFGAPHAVAVDCCTHGIELCLRHKNVQSILVPKHTYLSVPMLSNKLGIEMQWTEEKWQDYYYLTEDVIDAAVLWRQDSYVPGTYMCVSFQFRKHLSLGRGGIILFDKEDEDYKKFVNSEFTNTRKSILAAYDQLLTSKYQVQLNAYSQKTPKFFKKINII